MTHFNESESQILKKPSGLQSGGILGSDSLLINKSPIPQDRTNDSELYPPVGYGDTPLNSSEQAGRSEEMLVTQAEIIEAICKWIKDAPPSTGVLWLCGPEGAGKSTIVNRIADILKGQSQEKFAESILLSNTEPGRDDTKNIIFTLAKWVSSYQASPGTPNVSQDVEKPQTDIFEQSMLHKRQLQCGVIEPLKKWKERMDPRSPLPRMIVDGLEEFGDIKTTRVILNLLAEAQAGFVPLRFILSSRPECWIMNTLNMQPLRKFTRTISLSEDLRVDDEDIKNYLCDCFTEILNKYEALPAAESKQPWPEPAVMQALVDKVAGKLAYANAIVKFIRGDSGVNWGDSPPRRLQTLNKNSYALPLQ